MSGTDTRKDSEQREVKAISTFSNSIVIPIRSEKRFGKFDLCTVIKSELEKQKVKLQSGDILVVSSKFAAMAEGRFVKLASVKVSRKARMLASRYHVDAPLAQLVLDESEVILGGIRGFLLAVSKGILAPNAGIDRSNVPDGYAILYPKNPHVSAERLRSHLLRRFHYSNMKFRLGVVLSDSRVTPTRLGTIGIAIAAAGFNPVMDFRGSTDLFGNTLKVTVRAIADQLASSAQLVMGEADESVPIVIIRGCKVNFTGEKAAHQDRDLSMIIPYEKCLYIQGLKNSFKG